MPLGLRHTHTHTHTHTHIYINEKQHLMFSPPAQVGLHQRRVHHPVHPVRRGRRRRLPDRRILWRDPHVPHAGPRGEGLLCPAGAGHQQVHQRAGGAPVRVHHQGPGHQRQRPCLPGRNPTSPASQR